MEEKMIVFTISLALFIFFVGMGLGFILSDIRWVHYFIIAGLVSNAIILIAIPFIYETEQRNLRKIAKEVDKYVDSLKWK